MKEVPKGQLRNKQLLKEKALGKRVRKNPLKLEHFSHELNKPKIKNPQELKIQKDFEKIGIAIDKSGPSKMSRKCFFGLISEYIALHPFLSIFGVIFLATLFIVYLNKLFPKKLNDSFDSF
jgi:hypothetical protein